MALVKYNNNSISAITSTGLTAGAMTLIKEQTASSSSTISFVDGTSDVVLDSTYPIYLFKFITIHPSGSGDTGSKFTFNLSTDTGSNYNVTKTTTWFEASHRENDSGGSLGYNTNRDLAQGTGFLPLSDNFDSHANDYNLGGELWLFNPSSTTYVKHFMGVTNFTNTDYSFNAYIAGYGNTTSAVDAVQFKMSSTNIDAGTIKLYGIKDS